MKANCEYNRRTGEEPTLNDCDKCAEKFEHPHIWCCLAICGRFEACKGCDKGIRLRKE